MRNMHFYRDAAGDPRVEASPSLARLGYYLESDVQGNASHARAILDTIERVADGKTRAWQETGNAHTLTLAPEGAVIEAEFEEDAPACRLSLDDLRAAVAGWLSFLERTHREER